VSIDYAARVEELLEFVGLEYKIFDRQAIEILLAAQLPIAGLPHPWMILETGWYSLDTGSAWFTFGNTVDCPALPRLRIDRPRTSIRKINRWEEPPLLERPPMFFIEPHGAIPPKPHRRFTNYRAFVNPMIRLRVPLPKTAANLVLDPSREIHRIQRYGYLTKLAIDCRFRDPVPSCTPPRNFLYWAELASKLRYDEAWDHRFTPTPAVPWEELINQTAQAVLRRAYLFNRPVEDADWKVAARLMADNIPLWTWRMILEIGNSEGGYITAVRARKTAGLRPRDFQKFMLHSPEKYLEYDFKRQIWTVLHPDFITLARGEAFGPQQEETV
jgi:hypothetical protein